MTDYLSDLVAKARARVGRGYYYVPKPGSHTHRSLVDAVKDSSVTPIITEIKYASPSLGKIRDLDSPLSIAEAMVAGGACGISVLTEPDNFNGALETLQGVSRDIHVPAVMKDIVVSPVQLRAGADAGADAVVLISEVFTRGLGDLSLDAMIEESSRLGLEVLVEANTLREFERLRRFDADLFGINNRDLSNFKTDLSRTETILAKTARPNGPVVSESGIECCEDIRRLKRAGAEAFLVGTSVMKSSDVAGKVQELVGA